MKEGWKQYRLLDICDVYQPHTISKKELIVGGQYDVYGANGVIGKYDKFNHEESEVLLGCRGACGCINISSPRSWINGNAMVVHPHTSDLSKAYLIYLLRTLDYSKVITGTAQPQITRTSLSDVTIPVPSLSEQERIVSYLDAQFAKIDALKANTEQQLQAAKDLFQSALKEYLTPKEGWEMKTITEIIDRGTNVSYGIVQPGDGCENGIPVVRPVDLRSKFIDSIDGLKKTSPEISNSYIRSILNGKEILMCVRGTTGIVSLSTAALIGCNVTRGIVPFKISDDTLRSFVYYSLCAPLSANFIQSKTQGAALKQINIADVKEIPVYLPSLKEQRDIVAILDTISDKVARLQENYNRTLTLCNDLKQSLLKSIFE